MTVDLTLDSIMIPALQYYNPPFGTKKASGGLSTEEVNANIIAGFVKQRPVIITEDSATGENKLVEYNASLVLNAANLLFWIGAAAYAGCTCKVMFPYGGQFKYTGKTGLVTDTLRAGACVVYMWMGSWWEAQIGKCAIGDVLMQMPDVDAPGLIYGGQWEQHDYGGMFFRSAGGNAKAFTAPIAGSFTSGTVFAASAALPAGVAAGDLVIAGSEYRTISSISGQNITIDSAFSNFSNITNLLIGQHSSNLSHTHTFHGNVITGSLSKDTSGVPITNGGFSTSGCFSVSYSNYAQFIQNGNSAASRVSSINFNATPSGTNDNSGTTEARPNTLVAKTWLRNA